MNISSMKFPPWHIPTDDSAFSKWRTFRKCFPSSRNRLGNCFKVLFRFCFQISFTKKYHKCYMSVLHILYLAYFTCKVAAHSPGDRLSQWDWEEVCPGITFLAPTRTSQMLLASACSFATLWLFCAALKCLTRVENRTLVLHQLSQLLIFTGHKGAEGRTTVGIWRTNLLTHCPHQWDVYLHIFLPPFCIYLHYLFHWEK